MEVNRGRKCPSWCLSCSPSGGWIPAVWHLCIGRVQKLFLSSLFVCVFLPSRPGFLEIHCTTLKFMLISNSFRQLSLQLYMHISIRHANNEIVFIASTTRYVVSFGSRTTSKVVFCVTEQFGLNCILLWNFGCAHDTPFAFDYNL